MKKLKESFLDLPENGSGELTKRLVQFNGILDGLLEGIQIVDFNWRYVYVNGTIAKREDTTKEGMLGQSIIERYPGINLTENFKSLEQCMFERRTIQTETEFTFTDKSKKWFQLYIEPAEQGIMIRSIDITAKKTADEKVSKLNRLYLFISQVNQNIVRVHNESTLFRNACRMAIEFGKFKMAWIGKVDSVNKIVTLAEQSGIPADEIELFTNRSFSDNGPHHHVLRTGKYYLSNGSDPESSDCWPFESRHGIKCALVLPIRKSGNIVGTFNLYSTELDFCGKEEIDLLIEVTSDISFALDLFERERKHAITEDLIVKNEKQFRHTLDHMLEGIQIHDFNWRYVYVNNALINYSTYTKEELLGFTLMEKYPGIEQTPLYKSIDRCMSTGEQEHLETEFTFPNGTRAFFELSIRSIPEGIFILSVDRTEQKKAKDKVLKVNRLYSFISAINQSIVHIDTEEGLLNNACRIAVEIGKFKTSYIGLVDGQTGKLNIVGAQGYDTTVSTRQKNFSMDYESSALKDTPTGKALSSGRTVLSNDVQTDPAMLPWKEELEQNDIRASISVPIKMNGKCIGIFVFHSSVAFFFDEEEVLLLEEATGDISFALENFDKGRKHRITEELVLKNEIRFRSLIEKSADMITLVTANGELVYSSPAVYKMLGYSYEELLNKKDDEFIHPDDIQAFKDQVNAIILTPGASFSNEQRVLHKDGSWMWCEGTVTNLLDQPGVLAIVSNFRDISGKKMMEQQQEFNKNNLNALINNTSDLMWSVDTDINLITSNRPFEKMIRQRSGMEVSSGSSVLGALSSPEQSSRFRKWYERAFNGEVFSEIEHIESPTESWSEISFYPIHHEDQVIGAACHSRDISETKRSEQRLRISESFNRGILNSLNSQIAVIDQFGNIIAINESWKRFAWEYGHTVLKQTGVGNNYFDVCEQSVLAGDETATEVLSGMKNVLNGNMPVYYFEYACHSNMKMQWFAMRVVKFDSAEPMLVVVHEDISERKLAGEKLIHNNEELRKTNAELDRFVYSASHDLRAPLCSVLGLVSLVEIESKETPILEYTSLMRKSLNRLDGFIRNILSYSKNNRLELEIAPIHLRDTIDEVVNSLRHMKEAFGVTFDITVDERQHFYSDRRRFTIIIENLISNALKFQDHSRSNKYVKITAKCGAADLLLQIEDNGIGIALEHQSKIFDMFFRISGDRDGSGIGLYIVKETVEKLQGSIQVHSKEHEGTTFTISLKNLKAN
ncbi:MAG: PAS domain S-box protein [Bacteroidota bacterium]